MTTTSNQPSRRAASYGRAAYVHTADRVSHLLAHQYRACAGALPPDHLTVERTALRRAGGLVELFAEARHPGLRRFDHLIASDPDRLCRNSLWCLSLVVHLHHVGIDRLFAENPGTVPTAGAHERVLSLFREHLDGAFSLADDREPRSGGAVRRRGRWAVAC